VTGSGPHTVFGNVQVGNTTSTGTTTPVILSLGGTFSSTTGSNVKLRVYDDGSNIGGMSVSGGQTEVNTWSSGRLAFYRGTTQTAVFDAGGSLGIGTATPLSRLHVETSSVSSGNILTLRNSTAWSTPMMTSIAIRDASNDVGAIGWRYNGSGATVDMHIHSLYNNAYTNINNIVMTVRGNGNVGIGTVLPTALLQVSGSGSGSLMQISSHVSSSIFFVSGSGNIGIGVTDLGPDGLSLATTSNYSWSEGSGNAYATLFRQRNSAATVMASGYKRSNTGNFASSYGISMARAAIAVGSNNGSIAFFSDPASNVANGTDIAPSERMTILNSGNVGIGTSSPGGNLEVYAATPTIICGATAAGSLHGIEFKQSNTLDAYIKQLPQTGEFRFYVGRNSSWGGNMTFYTDTVNRMTISSAGNVGIGTTSPTQGKLVVSNAGPSVIANRETSVGVNSYWNASDGSVTFFGNESNHPLVFNTNNTERMRITSGGNVGIGTTAPGKTFVVSAAVAGSVVEFYNTRNNTSGDFNLVTSLGTNAANTNSYHYIASTGGSDRCYVYGNGNIVNSNNSYGTLSDATLKENIVDATPKLDNLLKLKVRNFNLIGDETKQIGFIAQEFEEVFPSMIDIDGKSGKKLIKTSVLVPMLVKAIQELSTKLDEATTRIKTLESR
jgi:hypothetical protein